MTTNHPRLRAVDIRPAAMDGRTALLLRDPLQLCEKTVVIPHELGPALFLCDGTRELEGLRASLLARFGRGGRPALGRKEGTRGLGRAGPCGA